MDFQGQKSDLQFPIPGHGFQKNNDNLFLFIYVFFIQLIILSRYYTPSI